ncbi:MAG: helix-turn-helix transcriptional regulator [Clostridia bacterium]|nr:helix-turn-helix transcriptional regulator [Clostridia bacterium]
MPTTLTSFEPDLLLYAGFVRKGAFDFESERFDCLVLFYLEEGRYFWEIGGQSGTAEGGDMVVCPPGEVFHRRVIEPVTLHVLRLGLPEGAKVELPVCVRIAQRERLAADFSHGRGHVGQSFAPAERHFLLDVWFALLDQCGLLTRERAIDDPIIREAIDYMNIHIQEKLIMQELSARFGFTPVSFIRRFTKAAGMTPNRCLIDLRIARAKLLLREGGRSIGEIAALCGYSSEYYFSNSFRKEVGQSPTAFRLANMV